MQTVTAYVMRLVCACLICALLQSINPNGSGKEIRKLLCGLFIVSTAISPLRNLDWSDLPDHFTGLSDEAEAAAAMGTDLARETYFSIIKDQSETYILDKAAELNLHLEVEVTQEEASGVPVGVILRGTAAPYARQQLTEYITETLGIGKEYQHWIG